MRTTSRLAISSRKGFTLPELLVASSIFILVIAAVAPGIHAVSNRDSSWTRYAYSDVVQGLFAQLRNATSWYGGLSVEKGENDKVELLPESYVSVFQSEDGNTDRSWHSYSVETQTRPYAGTDYVRVIRKTKSEYKRPGIYLRNVIARRDDSDETGTAFRSVAIMFSNPTGNVSFFFDDTNFLSEGNVVMPENSADTVNEFPKPASDKAFSSVDLEFFNEHGKRAFTVKAYKDKQFYVTLD